jgi:hypothetical protein
VRSDIMLLVSIHLGKQDLWAIIYTWYTTLMTQITR